MRFELDTEMTGALGIGAGLAFGTDHAGFQYETDVSAETREGLLEDLSGIVDEYVPGTTHRG
jgi:hypothetical protein